MRHKGYEGQDGLQGLTEQGLMRLAKQWLELELPGIGRKLGENGRWLGAPVVWGTLT